MELIFNGFFFDLRSSEPVNRQITGFIILTVYFCSKIQLIFIFKFYTFIKYLSGNFPNK